MSHTEGNDLAASDSEPEQDVANPPSLTTTALRAKFVTLGEAIAVLSTEEKRLEQTENIADALLEIFQTAIRESNDELLDSLHREIFNDAGVLEIQDIAKAIAKRRLEASDV